MTPSVSVCRITSMTLFDYSLHANDDGTWQVEDMSQKLTCPRGIILFSGTRKECNKWLKDRKKEDALPINQRVMIKNRWSKLS